MQAMMEYVIMSPYRIQPVNAVWQPIKALCTRRILLSQPALSAPSSRRAHAALHRRRPAPEAPVAGRRAWVVQVVHRGGSHGRRGRPVAASLASAGHRRLQPVLDVGEEGRQLREHTAGRRTGRRGSQSADVLTGSIWSKVMQKRRRIMYDSNKATAQRSGFTGTPKLNSISNMNSGRHTD